MSPGDDEAPRVEADEDSASAGSIEELDTVWDTLGIRSADLIPDSGGTITPPCAAGGPERLPTLASLPTLVTKSDGATTPELDMGQTLGQGGMGVVRQARQLPLDREVAVKALAPTYESPEAAQILLQEARITGSLEHPNIIPIHVLGRDSRDAPMFVMKRVDGVAWTEVIKDPEHDAMAARQREDPLEFHLEVLMQVCNAVHFAHSKGILHRDLKPDNVMIGPFGEVYVLDWGIAVSLAEDPGPNLRRARDLREVVGTPGYMAPEMAGGDGALLSERTDVFLLGAMLHECITGTRRHPGTTPRVALLNAYACPAHEYGPEVPAELAAICNRATARDPAARHASAEALRVALADFLRHRHSAALAREAAERLAQLRALLRPPPEERHLALDSTAHALFTECRFGFQHALGTWPENQPARDGLRSALELMISHQLDDGDPRAASTLMAELEQPPADLVARLAELERREEEERRRVERLRQMEQDLDPSVGLRTRAFMMLSLAVLYSAMPLVMGFLERRGLAKFDLWMLGASLSTFALFAAGFYYWARDTLRKTLVNRSLVASMFTLVASLAVFLGGCALLGVDAHMAMPLIYLIFAVALGQVAANIDRRIFPAAAVFALTFILSALFRGAMFEIVSAGNLAGCLCAALAWRPGQPPPGPRPTP